jgi:hypothetical protein
MDMVDREQLQDEMKASDYTCEMCGNKSRIKELEEIIATFLEREKANYRIKGHGVIVRETPIDGPQSERP